MRRVDSTRCSESTVTVHVSSSIGDIEVIGCDLGLHSVKQTDADDTSFSPIERKCVEVQGPSKDCQPVSDCVIWLENYFVHRIASISIPPLCPSLLKEGSFCEKALRVLPKVAPLGSTISYKDLARLCGNEKACRAAGQAMATNPVSLLIPCHRVISSQGKPGNYSHGKKNSIKVWLLSYEKPRS